MKLGSLFDGSGTCPLAASAVGIIPAWASEIEPFPMAVTQSRFPNMAHLGDITKINGAEIEPMDVITFGSPCQNLSIAGNRKGLAGEQSALFLEAVRIIKEMRCATNGRYPQIAIWENVYGAFSSNDGEDFRVVLESLWQICEGADSVPRFEERQSRQHWPKIGCIVGDSCSIRQAGLYPRRRCYPNACWTNGHRGGGNIPLILIPVTYQQESYDEYGECDTAPTLKASGGNYGGGLRS